MDTITLTIPSTVSHISQIITGFLLLKEQGWDVKIVDRSRDAGNPFYDLPVALAEYRGKRLVYDLWDGYQNPDDMRRALEYSDFYFKRSFSAEKNRQVFPEFQEKIHPLGLYYRLTHPKNPINEPLWKAVAKTLTGRAPAVYFVPKVFEGKAERRAGEPVGILFLTQLWDSSDPALSREDNEERRRINEMRIEIIRTLRGRYGDAFVGGLNDTKLSRELAPDLIVPAAYTERRKYIKLVHSCDICIGSMGLYESIGGKTGEYVAAAKAIVNERLHYTPTGDFAKGKNYLAFTTAAECVDAVRYLLDSPEALYAMKCANEAYYRSYLKPEVLVKNTLDVAARETVAALENNLKKSGENLDFCENLHIINPSR